MDREDKVELTKEILKTAAVVSVLTATMIFAPGAGGAVAKTLKWIFDGYDEGKKWQYRNRAKNAIKRLEKRGLIVTETKAEQLLVKITQAGQKWLKHYELNHMSIPRQKRWDGLWRVVVFDIPENKREIRDAVRGWLKRLGFARLQKSAWVIPWPCREQFDALCGEFILGNQAILLESKRIAKQTALRRIFNIS